MGGNYKASRRAATPKIPPAARGPDMAVATAAAPVKADEEAAAVETVLLEEMLPVPTATGLLVVATTEVVVETATAVEVDVPVVVRTEEEAGAALEEEAAEEDAAAELDGPGRLIETPA